MGTYHSKISSQSKNITSKRYKWRYFYLETLHVALLGFGTVGKGVYHTIQVYQNKLQHIIGKRVKVACIMIKNLENYVDFQGDAAIETDIQAIVENPNIEVQFDVIVASVTTFKCVKQSIASREHVITANKEMFAHHGRELKKLTTKYRVQIGYDATTDGGIPIIRTIKH